MDLSSVVYSTALCQTFKIHRSNGHFDAGGWIEDPETVISVTGIVTVAGARELRQVPEGDRVIGGMVFYSSAPLRITSKANMGTSDRIEWNGELYRLVPVRLYSDYGYYKAIGVRIAGD